MENLQGLRIEGIIQEKNKDLTGLTRTAVRYVACWITERACGLSRRPLRWVKVKVLARESILFRQANPGK